MAPHHPNPRKARLRRSPEHARAEILAAAEAALGELRFADLTVEELMRRTGMTRSALYHYFAGLDGVVLALLESFENDIRATVDPWLEGDGGDRYRQATHDNLTAMFRVFERHRNAVAAIVQAAGGSAEVYREWQRRVVEYFIDLTAAFIRRQVGLGRSTVPDPERLARALILMNNAVGNDNMTAPAPDAPEVVATVLAEIWNQSIFDSP